MQKLSETWEARLEGVGTWTSIGRQWAKLLPLLLGVAEWAQEEEEE